MQSLPRGVPSFDAPDVYKNRSCGVSFSGMKRKSTIFIIGFLLLLVVISLLIHRTSVSGGVRPSGASGIWRASGKIAHEGGPLIVFEFGRTNSTWTGPFFILDPSQPDNFAISLHSPIQIDEATERDLRFIVVWPGSHFRDEMVSALTGH